MRLGSVYLRPCWSLLLRTICRHSATTCQSRTSAKSDRLDLKALENRMAPPACMDSLGLGGEPYVTAELAGRPCELRPPRNALGAVASAENINWIFLRGYFRQACIRLTNHVTGHRCSLGEARRLPEIKAEIVFLMEIEDLLKDAKQNSIDLAGCLQRSYLIWSPALYAWQQVSIRNSAWIEDALKKKSRLSASQCFSDSSFLTNLFLIIALL